MANRIRQQVLKLQPAAQAVGDHRIRGDGLDFADQRHGEPDGGVMEVLFKSKASAHAATVHRAPDPFNRQTGDPGQQFQVWGADSLFPLVAGRVIRHAAAQLAQAGVQRAVLPQPIKIRPQVLRPFRQIDPLQRIER